MNIDIAQGLALTLTEASRLAYQRYFPGAPHQTWQHGSTTNRLFKPASEIIKANNTAMKVIRGRSDQTRAHRQPLKDFSKPTGFTTSEINLRYNQQVEASNDFCTLDGSAQIPYTDQMRGNDPAVAAVDLAKEVADQLMDTFDRSKAMLLHAPASGRLGLVNGTPKAGGTYDYDGAGAYSTATTARIRIDGGSIANFQPNYRFDIYSAAGVLQADAVEVITFNASDLSVWITLSADSTVANLDLVADNAEIFRSGERNNGLKSGLGAWFAQPSSGESFLGGVDRSTSAYAWLVPQLHRTNASSDAPISEAILNAAMESLDYRFDPNTPDKQTGFVFLGHTTHVSGLRDDIGNAAIVNQAPTNMGEYTFGKMTIGYIHPSVGRIELLGDPLAPLDEVRLVDPTDWMLHPYLSMGPLVLPRGEMGMFYWTEGEAAGSGKSKFLRVDATETLAYWCKRPQRQLGIKRVTG